MGGPSRFSNILEILENPAENFAWMVTISNTNQPPGQDRKYSKSYLLCFIFSNVPIIVSVVQSKPNNYLVLNREKSSFRQPEHKVQSLILQVQAGRISSRDQEAHRKLLEVDGTILRIRVCLTSSDIFLDYLLFM